MRVTLQGMTAVQRKLGLLAGKIAKENATAIAPDWWSPRLHQTAANRLYALAGADPGAQGDAALLLQTFAVSSVPDGYRYGMAGDKLAVGKPATSPRQTGYPEGWLKGRPDDWTEADVPGKVFLLDGATDALASPLGGLGAEQGGLPEGRAPAVDESQDQNNPLRSALDVIDQWVKTDKRLKEERNDFADLNRFPTGGGGYNALTLRIARLLGLAPNLTFSEFMTATQDFKASKLVEAIQEWQSKLAASAEQPELPMTPGMVDLLQQGFANRRGRFRINRRGGGSAQAEELKRLLAEGLVENVGPGRGGYRLTPAGRAAAYQVSPPDTELPKARGRTWLAAVLHDWIAYRQMHLPLRARAALRRAMKASGFR